MNTISLRKDINDYELYIFDLDGTLYFQKPFRIRMALYLIQHLLLHPGSLKDIFIIKKYREIRENWDKCQLDDIYKSIPETYSMEESQYEYVARRLNVTKERVSDAVYFFMMKAPLSLLPRYVDDNLREFITSLNERGKRVVIYSDYPVEDKLNALEIKAEAMYTSSDESIGVMKPDGKGIKVILSELSVASSDAVMIGDRYEKDGLSAIANGVDYIILSSKKNKRQKF